ncbi:hypothetical protein ACQKGL_16945 [Ensifer adhaerens]|uniref:hypothetical protein n=1 Tax=Ensifer adhaerens TaxID=106592 RepID=UPI003D023F18
MKSPWKYLLDLAWRRSAEQPESVPEVGPEGHRAPPSPTDAPVVTPRPVEVATTVEAAAVEVESDPGAEGTGNVVVETIGDKRGSAVASEQARATKAVDRPRRKPSKQQVLGKKSNARNVAVAASVEYGAASSDARVPPTAFADEVAALDEDIRQLRRQLAVKLSLQNAQLKKLLERF